MHLSWLPLARLVLCMNLFEESHLVPKFSVPLLPPPALESVPQSGLEMLALDLKTVVTKTLIEQEETGWEPKINPGATLYNVL